MTNFTPPELEGWDEILGNADSDTPQKRNLSQIKAYQKLVLGIANLGEIIFSSQKHALPRIDNLKDSIDRFNKESSKLYIIYIWLTVVIAVATLANVIITIVK